MQAQRITGTSAGPNREDAERFSEHEVLFDVRNNFQGRRSSTRPAKRTLLFGGAAARPGGSRRQLPPNVQGTPSRGCSADRGSGSKDPCRRTFGSGEEALNFQPPTTGAGLRARRSPGWVLHRFGGGAHSGRGAPSGTPRGQRQTPRSAPNEHRPGDGRSAPATLRCWRAHQSGRVTSVARWVGGGANSWLSGRLERAAASASDSSDPRRAASAATRGERRLHSCWLVAGKSATHRNLALSLVARPAAGSPGLWWMTRPGCQRTLGSRLVRGVDASVRRPAGNGGRRSVSRHSPCPDLGSQSADLRGNALRETQTQGSIGWSAWKNLRNVRRQRGTAGRGWPAPNNGLDDGARP
jgi:hypothetical protein